MFPHLIVISPCFLVTNQFAGDFACTAFISMITSSGALAGLSAKTTSHNCLITRVQVVSFRNQYGDFWFDDSTARGAGKHFRHLAIDRFQLERDWEQI